MTFFLALSFQDKEEKQRRMSAHLSVKNSSFLLFKFVSLISFGNDGKVLKTDR
jgi:hypothetical protein